MSSLWINFESYSNNGACECLDSFFMVIAYSELYGDAMDEFIYEIYVEGHKLLVNLINLKRYRYHNSLYCLHMLAMEKE